MRIKLFDQHFQQAMQVLDQKTKPPRSLGQLESIAAQVSAIQQSLTPDASLARALIFAADHGITASGVSAYPQEVTRQMLLNFAAGGAAINAICHSNQIDLEVINTGVIGEPVPGTVDAKIADGTANMLQAPAMTDAQYLMAIQAGRDAVTRAQEQGISLITVGEMGIGNTTAAAAIVAALCNTSGAMSTGRGTGLDDEGLQHKQQVVEQLLQLYPSREAADVLRCMGGFEIAALCGAMLQCTESKTILVVDGYITTAAALCAVSIDDSVKPHLIFAHQSAEPGHLIALNHLKVTPLLTLDMRLGEGSGAALAVPLIRSAVAILNDMATFESAGVAQEKN